MSCKKCENTKCTCSASLCSNPLVYAIKESFSLVGTTCTDATILVTLNAIKEQGTPPAAVPFTHTIDTALLSVLQNGIAISNNTNLCCPDCRSNLFFILDAEEITTFLDDTATYYQDICCIEHESSLAIWKAFTTLFESKSGGAKVKCCNTDFSDKISRWSTLATSTDAYWNLDTLLNAGIFESSSFNGYSGLGILLDYLELNHTTLTSTDYLNILGVILNMGMIAYCEDCSVLISSIDTYLTYK